MIWLMNDICDLIRMVDGGMHDEAISTQLVPYRSSCEIYEQRVKLGLLATPCKEPPWQPQLDALDASQAKETARARLTLFFPLLKDKVLRIFDTHPGWTSGQIAKELGVCSGYVRSTLTRNGRRLARHKIYP